MLYRKPIELRARDADDLEDLVHDIVVHVIANYLGLEPGVVDPGFEERVGRAEPSRTAMRGSSRTARQRDRARQRHERLGGDQRAVRAVEVQQLAHAVDRLGRRPGSRRTAKAPSRS